MNKNKQTFLNTNKTKTNTTYNFNPFKDQISQFSKHISVVIAVPVMFSGLVFSSNNFTPKTTAAGTCISLTKTNTVDYATGDVSWVINVKNACVDNYTGNLIDTLPMDFSFASQNCTAISMSSCGLPDFNTVSNTVSQDLKIDAGGELELLIKGSVSNLSTPICNTANAEIVNYGLVDSNENCVYPMNYVQREVSSSSSSISTDSSGSSLSDSSSSVEISSSSLDLKTITPEVLASYNSSSSSDSTSSLDSSLVSISTDSSTSSEVSSDQFIPVDPILLSDTLTPSSSESSTDSSLVPVYMESPVPITDTAALMNSSVVSQSSSSDLSIGVIYYDTTSTSQDTLPVPILSSNPPTASSSTISVYDQDMTGMLSSQINLNPITGTCTPGATVNVANNTTGEFLSTACTTDGLYSVTPITGLVAGVNEISVMEIYNEIKSDTVFVSFGGTVDATPIPVTMEGSSSVSTSSLSPDSPLIYQTLTGVGGPEVQKVNSSSSSSVSLMTDGPITTPSLVSSSSLSKSSVVSSSSSSSQPSSSSSSSSSLSSSSSSVSSEKPSIKVGDPYICGGSITGFVDVTNSTIKDAIVTLTKVGSKSISYTFNPVLNSKGEYKIIIQTTNPTQANFIDPSVYEVNYSATNSAGMTAKGESYIADIKDASQCFVKGATVAVATNTTTANTNNIIANTNNNSNSINILSVNKPSPSSSSQVVSSSSSIPNPVSKVALANATYTNTNPQVQSPVSSSNANANASISNSAFSDESSRETVGVHKHPNIVEPKQSQGQKTNLVRTGGQSSTNFVLITFVLSFVLLAIGKIAYYFDKKNIQK